MIISFDLDDTIIPGIKTFATEEHNFLQRIAGIEKIRLGTIKLFQELRLQGHSIYIYTTSFRPILKTKFTFYTYGIPVDKVINQKCHDEELKENKGRCSKFLPAFGIDLHVDDSPGLKIEGEKFNFKTIIIKEADKNWTQTILENLAKIKAPSIYSQQQK